MLCNIEGAGLVMPGVYSPVGVSPLVFFFLRLLQGGGGLVTKEGWRGGGKGEGEAGGNEEE